MVDRRRGWLCAGSVLLVLLLIAGCGRAGDVDAASTGGPVVDGSGPSVGADGAASLAPWCDDVPRPGPVSESDQMGTAPQDQALVGALGQYSSSHPDTRAGQWIDRAHGGTLVLAFTDDPAPHRAAIAELTAMPGDETGGFDVPSTAPGLSEPVGSPSTTAPPGTTVGQSGIVVDVVQVANSDVALQAVQEDARPLLNDSQARVYGTSVGWMTNRVELDIREPADDVRLLVAERLPVSAICVNGGPQPDGPTVDLPDSMIPPAGSDPLVTCGGAPQPLRLSALDDPPSITSDDPLLIAFEQRKDTFTMTPPGVPVEWYLLVRDDRLATFAAGTPPTMFLTMELKGDHWVALNGSSGGEPCQAQALLPEGLGAVRWGLDPAFPAPVATDTEVHVRVTESACTGSEPLGGRLVGPEVVERDGQVLLAFAARSLPDGYYNCPGNPSEGVTVTLPGPLGDRVIVDGNVVPPVPAEVSDGF